MLTDNQDPDSVNNEAEISVDSALETVVASAEAPATEAELGATETPETSVEDAPKTDAPATGDETENSDETRPSLAKIIEKQKRERGELSDEESEEEPTEKPAEVEAEKPAETETKSDQLKPDEVDTVHAKDSVSARARIRQQAVVIEQKDSEISELQTALEVVGGKEGLDEILSKIEILENPERVEDFVALVSKAPNADEIKDKFFWHELDNPANQAVIIADQFGDNWTMDRLKQVAALVDSGKIDVDSLGNVSVKNNEIEDLDGEDTPAASEKTENAPNPAETISPEEAAQWNAFSQSYDGDLFPVLQDLGVLPEKSEAPEIQNAKMQSWEKIVSSAQEEFKKNPEFQAIEKMIKTGKTDSITFKNKVRAFKPAYIDAAKRAVLNELPNLRSQISAIVEKQPAARTNNAPLNQPTQPAQEKPAAHSQALQTETPVEQAQNLSETSDRKSAFQKAVQRSAQRSNGQ